MELDVNRLLGLEFQGSSIHTFRVRVYLYVQDFMHGYIHQDKPRDVYFRGRYSGGNLYLLMPALLIQGWIACLQTGRVGHQ